jgi:CHASE3 domain sensor protein
LAALSRTKAGFSAGVALLTVILSASVVRNLAWQQSAQSVAHSYEVIERLGEISFDARDAEDAARAFTSSPNERDLARSMEDLVHAGERGREVEAMVADDATRRNTAQAVRLLLDQQAGAISRDARSGSRDEVSASLALLDRAGFDSRIRTAILEFESEEHQVIQERTAFQNQMTGVSRSLLILATLFAVCLVAAAAWTMSIDLKKHARAKHALAAREEQYRHVVELAGDTSAGRTSRDASFFSTRPRWPCCTSAKTR